MPNDSLKSNLKFPQQQLWVADLRKLNIHGFIFFNLYIYYIFIFFFIIHQSIYVHFPLIHPYVMQMFRIQVTISMKSPSLQSESFVTQSDGHTINMFARLRAMLPVHPVQFSDSLMDSIQQPKNRNRNIGQRDIRFLFRIAAILDGLACPREFFVFILGFLLFFL